jgi:DNA processing protein
MSRACPECLTRARLLEALAPRIDCLASKPKRPVRQLLNLSNADLMVAAGVPEGDRPALVHAARTAAARDAARPADGGGAVCIHDDAYPERLRELPDVPRALFHTGPLDRLERLVAEKPVALVGSRHPSAQAEQNAYQLGRRLSAAGVTVVSGLAFGIDAACHRGALTAEGGVIAVLASGADRASPVRNRALYSDVRTAGTVVSEMPWGAAPFRWMFPARNRIMAALGEMTVVVEATEKSGSLITATFALELGRSVGAMPGPAGARLTEGNNLLIRDGCIPVRGAIDVLDALYDVGTTPQVEAGAGRRRIAGDPVLGKLLDAVEVGETLEQMARRSGLRARELRAALARLERTGLIRRSGLRGYVATTTG